MYWVLRNIQKRANSNEMISIDFDSYSNINSLANISTQEMNSLVKFNNNLCSLCGKAVTSVYVQNKEVLSSFRVRRNIHLLQKNYVKGCDVTHARLNLSARCQVGPPTSRQFGCFSTHWSPSISISCCIISFDGLFQVFQLILPLGSVHRIIRKAKHASSLTHVLEFRPSKIKCLFAKIRVAKTKSTRQAGNSFFS